MNDKEKLTFTEVSKYLKAIPNDDTDKLVLVGGQALNLWADIYLSEEHELHPFTSKDLDFLINDIKVMDHVTNIWNGKLAINDDITSTHCGVATIEDVQNQIKADFMSGIVGVLTNDVRKKMLTIVLGAVELNVMHPIHCLESRFENIIVLRRHNKHAIRQLKIAIEVVNARIVGLLNKNKVRNALKEIQLIFKFLKKNKQKRQELFDRYGIDLFAAIPNDERLGKEYVEKRYPQMNRNLQMKGQEDEEITTQI